jgi:undecaprenyl phosphate N,N'-diacetylbacillosamine 1-phosphate transferase
MYRDILKPFMDVMLAFVAIVFLLPIIVLVTILLAIANRGKPFFVQQRPGKNGRIFKLIKFKTMRDMYNEEGKPLPDKDRITLIGSFIRKASLDELPQLFNVLKGDMSLIGPRPLLVKYLPLYNQFQLRRHEVKPGITGWAQVKGRNAIDWETKFKLDVWYVDHISFALDIKIIFLTVYKIFKREGINSSRQHTMKPFSGNL